MTLYYGQRDSSEKMNWKQADQKFETPKPKQVSPKEYETIIISGHGRYADTTTIAMKNISQEENNKMQQEAEQDAKISNKVYNPIAINQFGWINSDRLFKSDAPKTTLQFEIANKVEEVNYVNVYLVFKDIKSVMQSTYYFYDNKTEKNNFDNIPVGTTVQFLAVCYQHEKILAVLTDKMQVKQIKTRS